MEIIIPWLLLTFVVAYLGTDRKIGGGWAFLWALVLSPVVGFVVVAFSPSLRSIENDEIQRKQLEELKAIRNSLIKLDQVGVEHQIDQSTIFEHNSPKDTTISISKPTVWQRIKYRL